MRVKGSFKGNNNVLKLTLFEHEDHHFSHDSQASVRSEKSASERFFFVWFCHLTMEYCQHLYINTVCYQVLSAEQSAKGKGLLVDWLHISQLHYVMA